VAHDHQECALFADLPIEAQDRAVGLIAVIGAAYGAILKVTAKK
jgi:hypothetical protein